MMGVGKGNDDMMFQFSPCENFQLAINEMEQLSDFISLRGIEKVYGGAGTEPVRVLKGIDLDIHEGDFTAIMGAS